MGWGVGWGEVRWGAVEWGEVGCDGVVWDTLLRVCR